MFTSLPREVELANDGTVHVKPPPELSGLRARAAKTTPLTAFKCGHQTSLGADIVTGEFEVMLDVVDIQEGMEVGVFVLGSPRMEEAVYVGYDGASVFVDMRNSSQNTTLFQSSFRMGVVFGLIGTVMVSLVGHNQAQYMVRIQPMKMAAAEALWDSEDPAAMSLFTIGNEKKREDVFAIRVPYLLTVLAHNRLSGEVKGINDLQAEYEATYGPGNYVPPVAVSYWMFRIMVGAGTVMLLLLLYALYKILRRDLHFRPLFLKLLIWSIALPYLANASGWIFTEMARYPWVVFGLMRIEDAVSTAVTVAEMWISLIAFTLLYGALMGVTIFLLKKFARKGPASADAPLLTDTAR